MSGQIIGTAIPAPPGNLPGRFDILSEQFNKGRKMPPIIDHVTLGVSDFENTRRFYDRIMPTLGLQCIWDNPTMAAYGIGQNDDFGLIADSGSARHGTHVAFHAPDRTSVDRFHSEALAAGARDNGPPGLRPEYHATYYAAFVIDPEGNRIEAVCQEPVAS